MKTILMPTDFSDTASNAIEYAAEISNLTGAKLILFHAYQIPLVTFETTLFPSSLNEMEVNALMVLNVVKENLIEKFGSKFEIECKCKCGFAVDEIISFSKEYHVDLIVLGMHGSGFITERLMGSIATSVIRKASCPVITIDRLVKFRSIKKIALACDFDEIHDKTILNPIKEFAKLFHSHVYVINVVHEMELANSTNTVVESLQLRHYLDDIEYTFHFIENTDVIEGVTNFVFKKSIDMIAMIPRKHSIIQNIFFEPITNQMAFHTSVPLLTISESV